MSSYQRQSDSLRQCTQGTRGAVFRVTFFLASCIYDAVSFILGAKIPEGVPISLGNLAWGCQILGDARFPMTTGPQVVS